jgi:hypothetical protein
MTRSLLRLSLVLAALAVLAFAKPAPADEGDPFRLTGTETCVELVDVSGDSFTLRITVSGEGTIGSYEEVAYVTFTPAGDNTLKFDATTTITVLGEEGEPTGDVIYTTGSGTFSTGTNNPRNDGSFRIIGGEGIYEGASGSGAFKFLAPTETYTGVIH